MDCDALQFGIGANIPEELATSIIRVEDDSSILKCLLDVPPEYWHPSTKLHGTPPLPSTK
jgi:hypothetical protein